VNNQARVSRHPGYQPMDITSPWTRVRADTASKVELSGAKNSALTAPGNYCTNLTACNKQIVHARFGRDRVRKLDARSPDRALVAPDRILVNGRSPLWRNITAFAPHPFWRRSRSRSSKIAKFASNAFNVSSAPDVEAPAALSRAISSRCQATIRRSSATCNDAGRSVVNVRPTYRSTLSLR
jgi:hypothetical protein